MRYLYYCNSAYQILTILNLHWHRKYASFENIEDYDADLIVLNSFSQAEEITDVVRNSGLFSNVRSVNKSYSSGKLHAVNTILDFLFPGHYLKNHFAIEKKDICDRYSVICVPKYSTITAAIWRLNKKAGLHIFEDGAGVYWGSINLKPDSKLYKRFYKTFNHGRDFYDLEKFYVNDPRLYAGIDGYDVTGIPKFDEAFSADVRKMFSEYTNVDDLADKNVYYFAQFLNDKETLQLIDDLLERMSKYRKQTVYIPHPRHKDAKTYPFSYAKEKQIWEIRLSNIEDIERKLLISIHSTACITPKIMYDKEPYVLLFYKLCRDEVTYRTAKFDRFIDQFVSTYRDPEKIMIPESIEELFECIERYLEKEGFEI